ncbi:hypothetical protein E2C01_086707 [Portunus trituberculatus]|uniref:Uncharacterized protein n=1 Tax=Portunus trituberculatus TaxID=210409 RepID=A0A5B7JAG3_PORTR|nr:hypothetical protein [Portunus trituberculatus]
MALVEYAHGFSDKSIGLSERCEFGHLGAGTRGQVHLPNQMLRDAAHSPSILMEPHHNAYYMTDHFNNITLTLPSQVNLGQGDLVFSTESCTNSSGRCIAPHCLLCFTHSFFKSH